MKQAHVNLLSQILNTWRLLWESEMIYCFIISSIFVWNALCQTHLGSSFLWFLHSSQTSLNLLSSVESRPRTRVLDDKNNSTMRQPKACMSLACTSIHGSSGLDAFNINKLDWQYGLLRHSNTLNTSVMYHILYAEPVFYVVLKLIA